MKLAATLAILLPGCFSACHTIPRDIDAAEITSDITTPIFSHKITVKGLVATSCPLPPPPAPAPDK